MSNHEFVSNLPLKSTSLLPQLKQNVRQLVFRLSSGVLALIVATPIGIMAGWWRGWTFDEVVLAVEAGAFAVAFPLSVRLLRIVFPKSVASSYSARLWFVVLGLFVASVALVLTDATIMLWFLGIGMFAGLAWAAVLYGPRIDSAAASIGPWLQAIRVPEAARKFVESVELADPFLVGHSERIASLARKLARSLRLSRREQDGLLAAALLHDLGKMDAYVAKLLHDRGSPTAGERWVLNAGRNWSELFYGLTHELDKSVLAGIRHHREHFDGSGYPAGLARDAIPLTARIIAVCDSVDTLLTARTNRTALPVGLARTVMNRMAGVTLDPAVVEHIRPELLDEHIRTFRLTVPTDYPVNEQPERTGGVPADRAWTLFMDDHDEEICQRIAQLVVTRDT